MEVLKNNGSTETYDINKMLGSLESAFNSVDVEHRGDPLRIALEVQKYILMRDQISTIEIGDFIEETLMSEGFFNVAKSFIIKRVLR